MATAKCKDSILNLFYEVTSVKLIFFGYFCDKYTVSDDRENF